MAQRETIQVKFRGQTVAVKTCLSAEQAAELRGRWPEGVVVLEELGNTPLLTTEAARSWFVRAVCTILKIEDWRTVDRECTGRERYSPPSDKRIEGRGVDRAMVGIVTAPAKRAQPARQRQGRVERMHAARAAVRRS